MLPIIGQELFCEYEDVMSRSNLFSKCRLNASERARLPDDFLNVCSWVHIYFAWRPNLQDEAENHIMELAVAGDAQAVVTNNVGDFRSAELNFPGILILTPKEAGRQIL